MPHKYDGYYMGIADAVRVRAKCLGRTVGAVLVRDDRIIATGFNGTPSGMTNCTEGGCVRCAHPEQYPPGQGYDRCVCVHAEANCLLMAAKFGQAVAGSTLYTTLKPCFGCLKEMVQAGVVRIVYADPDHDPDNPPDETPLDHMYWELAALSEMERFNPRYTHLSYDRDDDTLMISWDHGPGINHLVRTDGEDIDLYITCNAYGEPIGVMVEGFGNVTYVPSLDFTKRLDLPTFRHEAEVIDDEPVEQE